MGAAQGKQQIKDYLGKHKGGLTQSQDTRHVNRIFKIYDTKKVGYLEFAQAEKFIDDVLSASGIKDQLTQQAGGDENFYPAQVKAMFAELDANGDGKIEVDDILKPGMSGIHTLLGTLQIMQNGSCQDLCWSLSCCRNYF
jgi:Ca2+-binding EF-hand superfamily protein